MRTLSVVLCFAALWSAAPALGDGSCSYLGDDYLNGSDVCRAGTRYRCENGSWQGLNTPCALQSILSQGSCESEGQSYPSGRVSCEAGTQQRCDNGQWQSLGTPCDGKVVTASSGFAAVAVEQRTCGYAGAHFQDQSVMCKNGTTFVCEGGRWIDQQAPCR